MMVFHCITPKKLKKYQTTGCILPPVWFWTTEYSAKRWMQKVGRTILLTFEEPKRAYPLPIKGGAKWSPDIIRKYKRLEVIRGN